MSVHHEDLRVPVTATETLYLKRFRSAQAQAPAVLMVHGMMSNGRVFYSQGGKGLAPWLARQGYEIGRAHV